MSPRVSFAVAVLAAASSLGGCGGAIESSRFANPNFDFGFVERVAVLPFENHSNDRQAGLRATRLTITELLASGAVAFNQQRQRRKRQRLELAAAKSGAIATVVDGPKSAARLDAVDDAETKVSQKQLIDLLYGNGAESTMLPSDDDDEPPVYSDQRASA